MAPKKRDPPSHKQQGTKSVTRGHELAIAAAAKGNAVPPPPRPPLTSKDLSDDGEVNKDKAKAKVPERKGSDRSPGGGKRKRKESDEALVGRKRAKDAADEKVPPPPLRPHPTQDFSEE
jgi:hypothetical protein